VTIQATLRAVRREIVAPADAALDFSVIAMGRFGGAELGFGSDADVLYVYEANGIDPQRAHDLAIKLVSGLRSYSKTIAFRSISTPVCGPRVATGRWCDRSTRTPSTTAAGRCRGKRRRCCGPRCRGQREAHQPLHGPRRRGALPRATGGQDLREIKRIKARVENERLRRASIARVT
jgi:glutamate-ammonia-ligase adenylyltransferase